MAWLWMAMRAVCRTLRRAVRRGGGWWTRAWNFVAEEPVRTSGRRVWRLWRRLPFWPQRAACAAGVTLLRCVSRREARSPGTRGVACPGSTRSGQGCGAGETADVLVVEAVGRVRRLAAGGGGRPRRCRRSVAEGEAGDLGAAVGCRSHLSAGCLRGRPGGTAGQRGCREKLDATENGRPRRCQRSVAEKAAGDLGAAVGCRSQLLAGCLRGRPGGKAGQRGCRQKLVATQRSTRRERPDAHRRMAAVDKCHERCRGR